MKRGPVLVTGPRFPLQGPRFPLQAFRSPSGAHFACLISGDKTNPINTNNFSGPFFGGTGGGQNYVCVALLFEKKATHKQDSQEISGNAGTVPAESRDNPGTILGQSYGTSFFFCPENRRSQSRFNCTDQHVFLRI